MTGREAGLEKHKCTFSPGMCCLLFFPYELNLDRLNPAHILQDIFFWLWLGTPSESSINMPGLFVTTGLFSDFSIGL